MQQPSEVYYRMRDAYTGWFWKTPIGLVVMGMALVILRSGAARDRQQGTGMVRGTLTLATFLGGLAILWSAAQDRAVYEVSRAQYNDEEGDSARLPPSGGATDVPRMGRGKGRPPAHERWRAGTKEEPGVVLVMRRRSQLPSTPASSSGGLVGRP